MKQPPTQQNPIQIAVGDGVLEGHIGGVGTPALLLHGGPGMSDDTEGCALELGRLFTTIRYTQRGTAPSTVGGPYTVETHMADAIAVLDALGLEKAWAIGHSWGGHLALHLAVAHPERLYGIVCIGGLGASVDVIPELAQTLRAGLTAEQRERVAEIDERLDTGEATEEELLERRQLLWPHYFFDPAAAPARPLSQAAGLDCLRETTASMREHFEAGTLSTGLRKVRLTALFAHGLNDPLPLRSALETAKYLRGAKVGRIAQCGHYPWLEQPGFLDRMIRGLVAQL